MTSQKKKNDLTRSLFEELRQRLAIVVGDPQEKETIRKVNVSDRAIGLPRKFRELDERQLQARVWELPFSEVVRLVDERRTQYKNNGTLKAKVARTEETR